MTAAEQLALDLAYDDSLPAEPVTVRQVAVVFTAQAGPHKGQLTYQPETEFHTREWLEWYAAEGCNPKAQPQLMVRTVTVGPWEPA